MSGHQAWQQWQHWRLGQQPEELKPSACSGTNAKAGPTGEGCQRKPASPTVAGGTRPFLSPLSRPPRSLLTLKLQSLLCVRPSAGHTTMDLNCQGSHRFQHYPDSSIRRGLMAGQKYLLVITGMFKHGDGKFSEDGRIQF